MKTYLQVYLDELKLLILSKASIHHMLPADCYDLSLKINEKTSKRISETTLKRIFGFASSIHRPSPYTLNALAEYCGFSGWKDFYYQLEQKNLHSKSHTSWRDIASIATRISLFNIQSNQYKSGIPYNKTIDRDFITDFVSLFEKSGATIGILNGAAGYGKTIAITRWVEAQINQPKKNLSHDIFLFTHSPSLFQASAYGHECHRWLAHLLDLNNTELLDKFMADHAANTPGNFYLVVDEIHSHSTSEKDFFQVVNQFIGLASYFARYKWFRIMLVMRTSTLVLYKKLFRDVIIKPQWFSALNTTKATGFSSLPAFSNSELIQLIRNLYSGIPIPESALPANMETLRIPLFFQYYYELNGSLADLSGADTADEYLIIANYLNKTVINGINNTAKQLLLEELSALVEFDGSRHFIKKKDAYEVICRYKSAYNHLLNAGILLEDLHGNGGLRQTLIVFQSGRIAAYFMALKLLNSYDPHHLPVLIDRSGSGQLFKKMKLKWLLLLTIESGDLALVNQFEHISIAQEDSTDFVSFICSLLYKTHQAPSHSTISHTPILLEDNPFVAYLLNRICFKASYRDSIAKLLMFDLSSKNELLLRTKLSLIDLLKGDEKRVIDHIRELHALSVERYCDLAINPYYMLAFLYHYFKHGITDNMMINKLKSILHHRPSLEKTISYPMMHLLIYMIAHITKDVFISQQCNAILSSQLDRKNSNPMGHHWDFMHIMHGLHLLACGKPEEAKTQILKLSPYCQHDPTHRLLSNTLLIQLQKTENENTEKLAQTTAELCEHLDLSHLTAYFRNMESTESHYEYKRHNGKKLNSYASKSL